MMKYQLIQHLKTKSKVVEMYDSVEECKMFTKQPGVIFVSFNYIGGFPIYNANNKVYSIQGYSTEYGIVCSIPEEVRKELV